MAESGKGKVSKVRRLDITTILEYIPDCINTVSGKRGKYQLWLLSCGIDTGNGCIDIATTRVIVCKRKTFQMSLVQRVSH